jgi:hypothetical protein
MSLAIGTAADLAVVESLLESFCGSASQSREVGNGDATVIGTLILPAPARPLWARQRGLLGPRSLAYFILSEHFRISTDEVKDAYTAHRRRWPRIRAERGTAPSRMPTRFPHGARA